MNFLLDTHTFVWLDNGSSDLSSVARSLIADPANTVFVSLVSIWEIQIKAALGKLALRLPLADIVADQQQTNGIQLLPVTLAHVLEIDTLPHFHKDPFDRLLIAQAQVEQLILITRDANISKYSVNIRW